MNEVDELHLLELARDAIESRIEDRDADFSKVKHIEEEKGVFIKLEKGGEFRGGCGDIRPGKPVYASVAETAARAAFEDPRFPPLKKEELDDVRLELFLLDKFEILVGEPEDYAEQIEIGKHGLMMTGRGKSLLLPSHATANLHSEIQFLNSLAQKAGLGFNAWKDDENKVYRFKAVKVTE